MYRVGVRTLGARTLPYRGLMGGGRIFRPIAVLLRYNSSKPAASPISDSLVSFSEKGVASEITTSLDSSQLGYLDSIGLAQGWGPTSMIEKLVEAAHVYTGLPWWGSILAATVIIRLMLMPLYMSALANAGRMSRVKPQLDAILAEIRASDNQQQQMMAMQKRRKIMRDNNISTMKQLAPLSQLPIAYGFFLAMREMALSNVEGFSTGGYEWFTNLLQADPYLGLHMISAALVFTMIKLGGEMGSSQVGANPLIRKMLLVVPFISIIVTKDFAASVLVYFAGNSAFSLFQSILFRSSTFRKVTGMPEIVKSVATTAGPQPGMIESFRTLMKEGGDKASKKSRQVAEKMEKVQARKLGQQHMYIQHVEPKRKHKSTRKL